jgi:hypothetical protein
MNDSHDFTCEAFFARFEMICKAVNLDYLPDDVWHYIKQRETPCGACCSWIEKNKSNLSGRLYLIQVREYRKSPVYTANKTAVIFDLV